MYREMRTYTGLRALECRVCWLLACDFGDGKWKCSRT